MKLPVIIAACALTAFVGAGAWAYHYEIWEKNELEESFCPKMADEKIYDDLKMSNYAKLIPGKDGWVFRSGNDFRTEWALNDTTVNYLKELSDAFRKKNAEIVYVMPPIRGLIHVDELYRRHQHKYLKDSALAWHNYNAMITGLQKQGVNVVGIRKDQATPDFFYRRDHHWTATGARITAENTAAIVKRLPTYANIPKQQYETAAKEPVEFDGAFEKAFRKICNTAIPTEVIKPFETTAKGGVMDQASLFDDSATSPKIILVGTSNSVGETSQANFEGFLKEKLSADVLNLSIVGAGIDTSILSFLNSESMDDGQPKIVIWEIPGYYDLNVMDDKLFNQVIPAAYGGCEMNNIVSVEASLKKGNNSLLDGKMATQNGVVSPKYLHLSFSKPITEKFTVSFQYAGGGAKKQQFDRFDGYKGDGEFYTLFPANSDPKQLRAVSVYAPDALAGQNVKVEVCGDPAEMVSQEIITPVD